MNVKSVPSCGLVYSALLGREAGTMSNKRYLSTLTKLIGRDKFPGACTWTQSVGQHGVVKKAISNLESLQEGDLKSASLILVAARGGGLKESREKADDWNMTLQAHQAPSQSVRISA